MFRVEMTSIPASRISPTSCHRFSLREPGTLVCASSSTSTWRGCGEDRVDVHLLEGLVPVLEVPAGHDLEVAHLGAVLARPWVSTTPTTTSVPRSCGGDPR